jgi:putative Holliday junction resolvase
MGRILGIDLGEKRMGLALSDELQVLASPLLVYERSDFDSDLNFLKSLIREKNIIAIVLGLPTNMDGSLGPKAQETLEFKKAIESNINLPIYLFDERLTTAEAERVLIDSGMRREKRRETRDKIAAVLILQSFLSARQKEAN